MATICPYCNIEVSEASIEAEDGCCPECGACISVAGGYMGGDDVDQFDEYDGEPDTFADIDEEEEDDDFVGDGEFDDSIFEDDDFGDGLFDEDLEELKSEDNEEEEDF